MARVSRMDDLRQRLHVALGGRYDILEQIGRGGAGVVFLVRHRTLGNFRVVKCIAPEMVQHKSVRDRFASEARYMSLVCEDPATTGVLRVHDASFGDPAYMLLDYAPGGSLAEHLEEHRAMHPRRAVEVMLDVLRGLGCAHNFCEGGESKPVIHRDLKPENILVDGRGRPLIADFGLARLVDASRNTRLTRHATTMGTAVYMSPEQQADAMSVDARTDIHAAGVLLWVMLKGRVPLSGASFGQLLKLAGSQTDAPAKIDFIDIPRSLEVIIRRAAAFNRKDRYTTVEEMMAALSGTLRDLPAVPFDEPGLGSSKLNAQVQVASSLPDSDPGITTPPGRVGAPKLTLVPSGVHGMPSDSGSFDIRDSQLASPSELGDLDGDDGVSMLPFVQPLPTAQPAASGQTIYAEPSQGQQADAAAAIYEAQRRGRKNLIVGAASLGALLFAAVFIIQVAVPAFSTTPTVSEPPLEVVQAVEATPLESVVELPPAPEPVVEAAVAPEQPPEPPKTEERRPERREPTSRETKARPAPPPEPAAEVEAAPEQPPEPQVQKALLKPERLDGLEYLRIRCEGQSPQDATVDVQVPHGSCKLIWRYPDTTPQDKVFVVTESSSVIRCSQSLSVCIIK